MLNFFKRKSKKIDESILIDSQIDIFETDDDADEAWNLFYEYSSNTKHKLTGYQRYRLINIISRNSEYAYEVLTNFYTPLDGNERLILLTIIFDEMGQNDLLLNLIDSSFIFTAIELNLIVSYILDIKEYRFIEPLIKKYILPQHLNDLLNSRAILDKLSEV